MQEPTRETNLHATRQGTLIPSGPCQLTEPPWTDPRPKRCVCVCGGGGGGGNLKQE